MTAAPPPTRVSDHTDFLHGRTVADPYRWLEDPNDPEVVAWAEAQNAATFAYLERLPARAEIRARLAALWDHERVGIPTREGRRWFHQVNRGLQNQAVLHVTEAPLAEGRVLLDPNLLAADGTTSIAGLAITRDGERLAYGLSRAGSDWQEWRVRDVATGEDRADVIRWVKFSGVAWTHDGAGFFYARYAAPSPGAEYTAELFHQQVYYHHLGTEQADDVLVYARPDEKEWGFSPEVSEDGRWLVLTCSHGTDPRTRLFVKDLIDPTAEVVPLLADGDAAYGFIAAIGETFLLFTDQAAPRGRLIAVDLADPGRTRWRELIPEQAATLEGITHVGGRLVVRHLADAHSKVAIHALDGAHERDVPLPGLGTATGFGGHPDDTCVHFDFTSFTSPATIYRLEVVSGIVTQVHRPQVPFDPGAFEASQQFVTSKDGTRVPMFVVHKRGVDPSTGPHRTYLYGYGGFNISLTPAFDPGRLAWLERGGVLVVATLRGGGEYGEEWHQAGCRGRKQNVFDDFIACAEALIARGWTTPSRLAIAGGSNGGLLVGACLVQRPDLFGAALPDVGVLDMLRFHRFTIGWAWVSDYGSPDDPADFAHLIAYSPLHNVRPAAYPATLVTTADHDDRVVAAHSYKFASALQAAQTAPAPILIRIDLQAGHGAGKPIAKLLDAAADRWSFLDSVLA